MNKVVSTVSPVSSMDFILFYEIEEKKDLYRTKEGLFQQLVNIYSSYLIECQCELVELDLEIKRPKSIDGLTEFQRFDFELKKSEISEIEHIRDVIIPKLENLMNEIDYPTCIKILNLKKENETLYEKKYVKLKQESDKYLDTIKLMLKDQRTKINYIANCKKLKEIEEISQQLQKIVIEAQELLEEIEGKEIFPKDDYEVKLLNDEIMTEIEEISPRDDNEAKLLNDVKETIILILDQYKVKQDLISKLATFIKDLDKKQQQINEFNQIENNSEYFIDLAILTIFS